MNCFPANGVGSGLRPQSCAICAFWQEPKKVLTRPTFLPNDYFEGASFDCEKDSA